MGIKGDGNGHLIVSKWLAGVVAGVLVLAFMAIANAFVSTRDAIPEVRRAAEAAREALSDHKEKQDARFGQVETKLDRAIDRELELERTLAERLARIESNQVESLRRLARVEALLEPEPFHRRGVAAPPE